MNKAKKRLAIGSIFDLGPSPRTAPQYLVHKDDCRIAVVFGLADVCVCVYQLVLASRRHYKFPCRIR